MHVFLQVNLQVNVHGSIDYTLHINAVPLMHSVTKLTVTRACFPLTFVCNAIC